MATTRVSQFFGGAAIVGTGIKFEVAPLNHRSGGQTLTCCNVLDGILLPPISIYVSTNICKRVGHQNEGFFLYATSPNTAMQQIGRADMGTQRPREPPSYRMPNHESSKNREKAEKVGILPVGQIRMDLYPDMMLKKAVISSVRFTNEKDANIFDLPPLFNDSLLLSATSKTNVLWCLFSEKGKRQM